MNATTLAASARAPQTTRVWSFRWEYYCAACREYEWAGIKMGSTAIMSQA